MAKRGRKPTGRAKPDGLFKSYLKEINKEIKDGLWENQIAAAKLAVKRLKKAVGDEYIQGKHSAPGGLPGKVKGDLQKGIGYAFDKHARIIETQVGFHRPAYHAHLMEFGTDTRYQKSIKGKPLKKLKFVGFVAPRPFFVKTLEACKEELIQLLSRPIL